MNSDFPFLYEGDDPEDNRRRGGWEDDGIHRELDNLTADQFLQDEVMKSYEMYMRAKGMDPKDYTLNFEIIDNDTALGNTMPVITQDTIHNMMSEFGGKLEDMQHESMAVAALLPSLRLSIRSSELPIRTKELTLEKIDGLIDVLTTSLDASITALLIVKELNALINTSAMIENERIKIAREAKGGNDMLSDAGDNIDV